MYENNAYSDANPPLCEWLQTHARNFTTQEIQHYSHCSPLTLDDGEPSRESTEEPDFRLMAALTDVERGGAGGGGSPNTPPPPGVVFPPAPQLPLTEGREDNEVRLI